MLATHYLGIWLGNQGRGVLERGYALVLRGGGCCRVHRGYLTLLNVCHEEQVETTRKLKK